jgi:D-cysteine desulfhydrase family pyridoxal phosphate-dependent enzyme
MNRTTIDLSSIPRVSLALLPTPLQPAPQLAKALGGPQLWLKRDDLTGFGGGGNKARGLEFLLADALAQAADTLVTGAGPQSNHVRTTAAAAAYVGLAMVAVYFGAPTARAEGNERLARLFGAEVRFTGDPDRASVDYGIVAAVAELSAAGRRPYAIPRGGANALGALGYVLAARELAEQCAALGLNPDAIVLATGSCGTQAGLLAGLRALGLPWRVEGFTVSRSVAEAGARVLAIAGAVAARLGLAGIITADDVIIHDGFIGPGYGVPTPAGAAAMRLAARHAGVLLDPTYTGKAFAGFMAHIHNRRFQSGDQVIFLHTGGEPALFVGDEGWLHD